MCCKYTRYTFYKGSYTPDNPSLAGMAVYDIRLKFPDYTLYVPNSQIILPDRYFSDQLIHDNNWNIATLQLFRQPPTLSNYNMNIVSHFFH